MCDVDGMPELLAAADAVLAVTQDRVMSCPRYGGEAAMSQAA